MSTFVILAGGRGARVSRVGGGLAKALLPLNGRAILSHLLDLAPPDARIVISVGCKAAQIRDYVALAHADRYDQIVFCDTKDWDAPGAGPGSGLLACRDAIDPNDDLVFTSCDTLWDFDETLWKPGTSWVGVAPVPAGTDLIRWCRIVHDHRNRVQTVLDKRSGGDSRTPAYVGLARISASDLAAFWSGVIGTGIRAGELQVSGGFDGLLGVGHPLQVCRIHGWLDLGDENGYRSAVARDTGYDWTKIGQATYVLPDDGRQGRVIKYADDRTMIDRRYERGVLLAARNVVAPTISQRGEFMACEYVDGEIGYEMAYTDGSYITRQILDWFERRIWATQRTDLDKDEVTRTSLRFYHDKTLNRIRRLPWCLQRQAEAALRDVDWYGIARRVRPGLFHGDLNHGNIIYASGALWGIDWREDFAGQTAWGDLRYDVAKLLAGTYVDWHAARIGDFRPWPDGPEHAEWIRAWVARNAADSRRDVEIIGALSLLNSAPLHAEPLDEILVARGVAWLEEVLT